MKASTVRKKHVTGNRKQRTTTQNGYARTTGHRVSCPLSEQNKEEAEYARPNANKRQTVALRRDSEQTPNKTKPRAEEQKQKTQTISDQNDSLRTNYGEKQFSANKADTKAQPSNHLWTKSRNCADKDENTAFRKNCSSHTAAMRRKSDGPQRSATNNKSPQLLNEQNEPATRYVCIAIEQTTTNYSTRQHTHTRQANKEGRMRNSCWQTEQTHKHVHTKTKANRQKDIREPQQHANENRMDRSATRQIRNRHSFYPSKMRK